MSLVLIAQPEPVCSVAEKIEYVYRVDPDDYSYGIYAGTPFGLAIINITDTTGMITPPCFIGQIIHITDPLSIYHGSHVVTEILPLVVSFGISVVVNSRFIGSEFNPSNSVALLSTFNCELWSIAISPPVWTPFSNIATINFFIKNNTVKLNVSEYVRSTFADSAIRNVTVDILGTGFPQALPVSVINSSLKTSEVTKMFNVSGSSVVPRIVDSSKHLIFFKEFRTFLSNSAREAVSIPSVAEIYSIVDSNTSEIPILEPMAEQIVEIVTGCISEALNIVYLNFAGGLRNYVCFNQIQLSRRFSEETRFKNDQLLEFIQSVQSYEEYEVVCNEVKITHSESIDQMIASPLTWLTDSAGNLTPIVIEKKTFVKYKSFDQSLNFKFSFRKSETIQSQIN